MSADELPQITGPEAVRVFEKAGFVHVRTKGSHWILKREGHKNLLCVPCHGTKPLGRGLLNSLVKASGLSKIEFKNLT